MVIIVNLMFSENDYLSCKIQYKVLNKCGLVKEGK